MKKFLESRSQKAGLSPGSLVHIGSKRKEGISISLIDYDPEHIEERIIEKVEECFPYHEHPTVTWINVEGLDASLLEKMGGCYGIHPLIQEDILNTDQRPKLDDMENYIYLVLKMLDIHSDSSEIYYEQVSFILGENYVISFQEGDDGDVFDSVRNRIRNNKGRIRKMGTDYLAYTLIDCVVDRYFLIMEKLGERMEEVEDELISDPTSETLRSIHFLKREMLFLRKSVWPLREMIFAMEKNDSPLIKETTRIFFRDIYDHTVQIIDTIETFREMLSGMLDIYLSSVSNRMNQVMKVLTIIATIFIPLTFIVGVYGMNFQFMPEIKWRWGYPMIWLIIVSVSAGMVVYFKKKNWW